MQRATSVLSMTIALLVSTGCATTSGARYGENCVVTRTNSFGTQRIISQRDTQCVSFSGGIQGAPIGGLGMPMGGIPMGGHFEGDGHRHASGAGLNPWYGSPGLVPFAGVEYFLASSVAGQRGYIVDLEEENRALRASASTVRAPAQASSATSVRSTSARATPASTTSTLTPTAPAPTTTTTSTRPSADEVLEWLRNYNGGE